MARAPSAPWPELNGEEEPATEPGSDHDDPREGEASERGRLGRRLRRTVVEWLAVIVGGVIIALVIEAFLIQAFWIPSESMEPTLHVGDRVLVNKLSYRFNDIHRGDLIVFERPAEASTGGSDGVDDLIKRVIATEGDRIDSRDGRVLVNGQPIEEPYLEDGTPTHKLSAQTIPEDHVFVMGDNRLESQDSREFGPISEDRVVGRAFVRVLPLSRIGWL